MFATSKLNLNGVDMFKSRAYLCIQRLKLKFYSLFMYCSPINISTIPIQYKTLQNVLDEEYLSELERLESYYGIDYCQSLFIKDYQLLSQNILQH